MERETRDQGAGMNKRHISHLRPPVFSVLCFRSSLFSAFPALLSFGRAPAGRLSVASPRCAAGFPLQSLTRQSAYLTNSLPVDFNLIENTACLIRFNSNRTFNLYQNKKYHGKNSSRPIGRHAFRSRC